MRKRGIFLFLILLSMKVAGQLECRIYSSSADTAVCYGENVSLYTAFSDTLNYYWEPVGETGVIIEVIVTEPVTYILHVFNNDSSFYCTDSITLNLFPYPELEIHHFPEPIPVHAVVTLSFEIISGDPGLLAHWEWIIDDSVCTDLSTLEYVFHYPGSYYIRLNYQTIDNCWFFTEHYLEANYSAVNELMVHNFSISPNPAKDLLTFSFFLKNPANVELAIYNTPGELATIVIPSARMSGPQNVTCNVGSMPPGLYFARLTIDKNSHTVKIVVK